MGRARRYDVGGFPGGFLLGHLSLSLDTLHLLGRFLLPALDLALGQRLSVLATTRKK